MIRRFGYLLHCIEQMTNDVIIVCSDHGTNLGGEDPAKVIDELPLIVNREIDLSKINYQWDIKSLILKLKDEKCLKQ